MVLVVDCIGGGSGGDGDGSGGDGGGSGSCARSIMTTTQIYDSNLLNPSYPLAAGVAVRKAGVVVAVMVLVAGRVSQSARARERRS